MGRKRTEEDQVESLERKIRELKSINRSLMKRLKNVSRGYKRYLSEDVETPYEQGERPKKEEQKVCFDCGRGTMDIKIILNRRWRECSVCGKRTSTKLVNPDGSVGPKTTQN